MNKTIRHIKELYLPKSRGEKLFVTYHNSNTKKTKDINGNQDDVFNASNVPHSMTSANAKKHGYRSPEDSIIYKMNNKDKSGDGGLVPSIGHNITVSESVGMREQESAPHNRAYHDVVDLSEGVDPINSVRAQHDRITNKCIGQISKLSHHVEEYNKTGKNCNIVELHRSLQSIPGAGNISHDGKDDHPKKYFVDQSHEMLINLNNHVHKKHVNLDDLDFSSVEKAKWHHSNVKELSRHLHSAHEVSM